MDTTSYVGISVLKVLKDLDNYRKIHSFSISPYARIYILCLKKTHPKGREREHSIFMKTEAWTLLSISLPKRGEDDSGMIRNSCENNTESQLQDKE